MDNLHSYLTKYRTLAPPHASKIKLLVSVINDELGVSIEESAITIRRGGATLACHPTVRSEVARVAPLILLRLQQEHNVRLSFIR